MSTTLQVSITLSDDELTVLRRYLAEANAVLRMSNAMLSPAYRTKDWTQEEAITMLLKAQLDQERKLQQMQDGRDDPMWIRAMVREAIYELIEREGGQR